MFEQIRKRLAVVPVAVWITAFALAAIGVRYLWVQAERPAHLEEIVNAYGSVSLFKYMPQPSPSGEWVTYVETGDEGFELRLANVATGQTKTLRKENDVGELGSDCDFRAWPWSPDGACFACSQTNEVFLGNPQTGEIEADMEVPATVTALVWLGTNEFLCEGETSTNSGGFYRFQKQIDGKWHRESELENAPWSVSASSPSSATQSNICALGSDAVLWEQSNCIWSVNRKSTMPALLLDLGATGLSKATLRSFSYSELTSQFLLNCVEKDSATLWSIGLGEPAAQLQRLPSNLEVEDAVWLKEKGATRSGWVGRETRVHNLVGSLAASPDAVGVLLHANVGLVTVAPETQKVFFIGTISNEPAYGLWQYDLVSKRLSCVVPGAAVSSPWAREIDPVATTLKTASGGRLRCEVYKPADIGHHQKGKYPLVIGDTFFGSIVNGVHGRLWIPALAANGAYVVFVARSSWNNGINKWGDDVSALCDKMLENPEIDTNRVYLFGASEETRYMSDFLTDSPRKWAGAIFLNPAQLPDLSKLRQSQHAPRILISTGELEGRGDRFKRYQADALKSGNPVDLFIASGEGHHFVGNKAQQQRTRAIADFIFNE